MGKSEPYGIKRNFLYMTNVYIRRIENLDPAHIAEMDADPTQQVNLYQVQIYFADKSQNDLIIKA